MTSMSARTFCYALAALLAVAAVTGCGSGDPSALIASAKGYIGKSDYKSATIQLKSALQQAPDNAEARFLLAKSLLASGEPAAAQAEIRKALELKYPADEAYPVLARTLLAQGEFQKLIAEVADRRLGSAQSGADLGTSVATAYMALGDQKKARSTVDAVLPQPPADVRALTPAAQLHAAGQGLPGSSQRRGAALALPHHHA